MVSGMRLLIVGDTGVRDAVVAGPFYQGPSPVLFVGRREVPELVLDEIRRLAPDELIIFGGPARVSVEVEAVLSALAPTRRIAGSSVFSTAVAASKFLFPDSTPPPPPPPSSGDGYTHTVEIGVDDKTIEVQSDTRYVLAPGVERMDGGGRPYAFLAPNQFEHVLIDGIEMTGYVPPMQNGVIEMHGSDDELRGRDLVIDGVHIHDCDEVAIRVRVDDVTIRNFLIEDMGRLGLSVGHKAKPDAVGALVENGVIRRCNADGRNQWGFEAGGTKFWASTNLTVRNVESYGHVGPGIWADKDNVNFVVEDCDVHDCQGAPGIFHEISGAHTIRNNQVRRCDQGSDSWLWGAGIQVASSNGGRIYGNIIEDCGSGISLSQQDRGSGAYGPHLLLDMQVWDNTIVGSQKSGVVIDAHQVNPNIWGESSWWNNRYIDVVGSHRFAFQNSWHNVAGWRGFFPQDAS